MLGGLISATMLITVFGLTEHSSTGAVVVALLGSLAVAMVACGVINATIEFVAYRPLRGAPRLAPLITAIGMSFILQNVATSSTTPATTGLPRVSLTAACSRSRRHLYVGQADRRHRHRGPCWSGSCGSC